MTNTNIMTVVSPKYSAKDFAITFPTDRWVIPANVIDTAYFQTAVQFHTYKLGGRFLYSEIIRLELKKYDENNEKAVEKYKKDLENAEKAYSLFVKMFKEFTEETQDSLKKVMDEYEIAALSEEISNDKFAETYTAVMLKFYTHTEHGEVQDDGTMKPVKKQNTDIFPLKDFGKDACNMKSHVIALENVLSDPNTKKDDKMKAYKPLWTHLQDVLFPVDNGIRYKPANFHKMSARYFQAFLSSTRLDAEKGLAIKDPFILVKNIAYTGMAWMKVIDIADMEQENTVAVENIKKREPDKNKAPKSNNAENAESGK